MFPASAVAADQVPLSVQSVAAQFTADALAAEVVNPQSTVVPDNRDQTLPTPLLAVTPTQSDNANSIGQPVYAVGAAVNQASDAAAPDGRYRIHVVHPGDSLDRLAERYLNDEARSFEIFNLNSDVLANPHLLPIGAELKIPVPPASD